MRTGENMIYEIFHLADGTIMVLYPDGQIKIYPPEEGEK
jgi:hypothetical protein